MIENAKIYFAYVDVMQGDTAIGGVHDYFITKKEAQLFIAKNKDYSSQRAGIEELTLKEYIDKQTEKLQDEIELLKRCNKNLDDCIRELEQNFDNIAEKRVKKLLRWHSQKITSRVYKILVELADGNDGAE